LGIEVASGLPAAHQRRSPAVSCRAVCRVWFAQPPASMRLKRRGSAAVQDAIATIEPCPGSNNFVVRR
jgi:hypothetical protein